MFWYDAHWPIFNVADIAICVGVGLFLLSSLLRKPRKAEGEEKAASTASE